MGPGSRSRAVLSLFAALTGAAAVTVGLTSAAGAKPDTHAARAAATTNAADCQPYSGTPCLLPFPSNLFTKPDHSSATGLRVHLPQAAMPVNVAGQRVGVAEYDRNDGFEPASAMIVHVAGLDNAQAFQRTGAAPLTNMATSLQKSQPIVVIDEQTGKRQVIWSELDANATTPQATNLMIHAGTALTDGHTYVVALRNLRTSSGAVISAPHWFELLRDNKRLPASERSQSGRYKTIFGALKRAKIGRTSLYEAWDFTVGSRQNLTSRLLTIRNNAFSQLGDNNLADGKVQGKAPAFTVSSTSTITPQLRKVQGSYTVPCYLTVCGPSASGGFHYSSHKPDALPTQIPGNKATATFTCIVPTTAGNPTPARPSLYGHGLLGSQDEVTDSWVQALAVNHNMVFCATDWWGLAQGDVGNDVTALANLNDFPNVVDRLQQGVLNTLFLGRLMISAQGLGTNAAFQAGSHSVIDTSHLYYDGNSQGGIEGGLTTAVAPDFTHAVLGVTGMDYGNALVERSVDFAPYGPAVLFKSYTDPSMDQVVLDVMQQLWDRGDPDAYAAYMTAHPLPDTPAHQVLMQNAYGDFQVSQYSGALEARTIGASAVEPALDPSRSQDKNLLYGIPAVQHYPFHGSAIEIWDSGPGRVLSPPVGNIPPTKASNNIDPHSDPRKTPLAQEQISDFLQPNGAVVDVCAGMPCHTSVFTP